MQFLCKFFESVFLALILATTAASSPLPASLKPTTLRVHEISPGVVINSFHPESLFEASINTMHGFEAD